MNPSSFDSPAADQQKPPDSGAGVCPGLLEVTAAEKTADRDAHGSQKKEYSAFRGKEDKM